jgi:hypothetical protein
MRTDLYGILGRALDPQSLQTESTSAVIDALTLPKGSRFDRMTPLRRQQMRDYYMRSIATEEGKCARPAGATAMPWMIDEWRSDLNQLERVMKSNNEIK